MNEETMKQILKNPFQYHGHALVDACNLALKTMVDLALELEGERKVSKKCQKNLDYMKERNDSLISKTNSGFWG